MSEQIESRHRGGNGDSDRDRRYRFFIVTGDQMMALLGNWWHSDFICLPRIKGLPEGYIVEAIHPSFERDGILLRIYHPSFVPVKMGKEIPYMSTDFESIDLRKLDMPKGVENV